MRNDLLKFFSNQEPISIKRIGSEIISGSETAQNTIKHHAYMMRAFQAVSWGFFGVFVIREFTKPKRL